MLENTDLSSPPVITLPNKKNIFKNKKVMLGILGIILLLGGLIAGAILVQQRQLINQKAADNCAVSWVSVTSCFTVPDGCTVSGFVKHTRTAPDGTTDGDCVGTSSFPVPAPFSLTGGTYCPRNMGDFCGQCVQIDGPGGGTAQFTGNCTTSTPTPTPKAICGERCNTNADCAPATFPGVQVACRGGYCVNAECADAGGATNYGTQCTCVLAHQCGAECGGDIGLCAAGLTCTYRGQTQCSPTNHGVCIPPGSNTSTNRGPIISVPQYEGAYFERKRCGGNADPENNYIYHPSFPNHIFTKQEAINYLCNPSTPIPSPTASPSPTPTVSPTPTPTIPPDITAQCVSVQSYDENWEYIPPSEMAKLQPGDIIRITVIGNSNPAGKITRARFTVNGTVRNPVLTKKPGTTNEFYDEISIPEIPDGQDTLTISIKAELYHSDLDAWF